MRSNAWSLLIAILIVPPPRAPAQSSEFELDGQIKPERAMSVFLQGATTPFHSATESDLNGHFRFRKLLAGAYVLETGGVQRTIEVGPGLADSKHRVKITIDLRDATPLDASRGALISARQLSVPDSARREYEDAEKALEHRDVPSATAHLKRAVEIAPQFSDAWNHLGTLAYQTRQFEEAESDFRKALDADPSSYAPLVNLGGVLINLDQLDEALKYNLRAVEKSPSDALSNSQLGMTYFGLNKLDEAEKYLTIAKRIDPAHFSHPQLLLAQIYLRRDQPQAAAAELRDLLDHHPDLPDAARIRQEIARLASQRNDK